MKRIIYILIMIVAVGGFNSCEPDLRDVDMIKDGPNLVVFKNSSQTETQVSETGDFEVEIQIKLTGPTTENVSGDITVTFEADPSSSAIEGKHYEWISKEVVLKKENNYLAILKIIQKTDGVEYPSTAVLNLKVANATGASNVIASGKPTSINLTYVCPYHLGGKYHVHTVRGDGKVYDWTENITEIGIGTYITQYVGTWQPPLNPNYGYLFYNVCDAIDVPAQNLADMYSNQVYGGGSYDVATGVIDVTYTIEFSSGNMTYHSVYTPAN